MSRWAITGSMVSNRLAQTRRSAIYIALTPRRVYRFWNRRRLLNTSPSIISVNCVGGVILSDLGLRFNTPTINLFIPIEEFMVFVRHLIEYIDLDVQEVIGCDRPYPVGRIVGSAGVVHVHFVHYGTFEEAKEKWILRRERLDVDNLFVILEAPPGTSDALLREFDQLPIKNKVALTARNHAGIACEVPMGVYDDAYHPGKILEYKRSLGWKRYLDEFDYVRFLNTGVTPAPASRPKRLRRRFGPRRSGSL